MKEATIYLYATGEGYKEFKTTDTAELEKRGIKILNGRGKKVDHQLARALANVYAEPKPMKQRA